MPNTLEEKHWDILLKRIKDGKCTPFLGAGACTGVLPSKSEIAKEWAQECDYPLEDSGDLARVAQFLATDIDDPLWPKEKIVERCKNATPPDFKKCDEPHGVLADLPLPIYITTNYNDFMIRALKNRYKDPKQELCKWWQTSVKNKPSIFDSETGFSPTPANPVVFHLFGHDKVEESLVLTEDDYLKLLADTSRDSSLLPLRIQGAFGGKSLLFLGYQIGDWDFRILLHILAGYKSISPVNVSVQIDPPVGDKASETQKEKAKGYLKKYFEEKHNIYVYWGKCNKFAAELRERWEAFNCDH